MNNKKVYILGAGSSIGHSQGLFPSANDFFRKAKDLNIDIKNEYPQVVDYVQDKLGKDISTGKGATDIEDLFTYITIELEGNITPDLERIRRQLFVLIQRVLVHLERKVDISVNNAYEEYVSFCSKIGKKDTIITFNWDLLLDNILKRKEILKNIYMNTNAGVSHPEHYNNFIMDISAIGEGTIKHMSMAYPHKEWKAETGYYLKAHGSIDWFYCTNDKCRAFGKVFPSLDPEVTHFCSECFEELSLLLIPPVLNKEYRKYPIIRKIWNLAKKEISVAGELVIWGYSLPPTDFYSLWLLRQARQSIKKLTIINPFLLNTKGVLRTSIVKRFQNIYHKKIDNSNIFLYSSYKEYCENKKISYNTIHNF